RTTIPPSCTSRTEKRRASMMTGLPLARASAPACCKASAAFTVKRSGLIMAQVYFATSVPKRTCRYDRECVRTGEHQRYRWATLLHHNHLPREPLPVHDELIDINARRRRLTGVPDVPVPVGAIGAAHRARAAH